LRLARRPDRGLPRARLTLCRQIVELMGGTIDLDSELLRWTRLKSTSNT
jgi:hypothetical protein